MNDKTHRLDASDSGRQMGHSACPGPSGVLRRLRSWRRRLGLEATLRGMTDRVLDDVGIVRGEIPVYARAAPSASRLLASMLHTVDVPPETMTRRPELRHALLRSCRVCPNVATCERWLRACTPPDAYRTFCPNAGVIDALPRGSGALRAPTAPQ